MMDIIVNILTIIGSLGFFIFGMKVMSEGLQKAAGEQLKLVLATMTKNRYFGVLSGFLITAIIQSSSATTVMTVSFVNAGLLSLTQSAGIMMGANIGTTVTAWLVSIFGFKVHISSLALPIIAIAFPMIFIKRKKIPFWGEFLIGFALLFMGLGFLKESVPDIKSNPELLSFLQEFTHWGYGSYLLFILIGTLLTIIVQSSSASMTITLVLVAKGWISFDIAAALVLGENIGTTITAELASLIGNVYAKRAARIHSMFNIIGVTWMLMIFPFFLMGVDTLTEWLGFANPQTQYTASELTQLSPDQMQLREESVTFGLSIFHTMFNLSNVLLLIGFAPKLVNIATRTVKSKSEEDEEFHLEYIDIATVKTPGLSLLEVKKELVSFGLTTKKMINNIEKMFFEVKLNKTEKLLKKLRKQEENTDRLEIEIANYLLKVSAQELNPKESLIIQSMLSIGSDMERLGDLFYEIGLQLNKKSEERDWFTPKQRTSLISFTNQINDAIENMVKNLGSEWGKIDLILATEMQIEIVKSRKKLQKQHIRNIEKHDYNIKSGLIYSNLYNLLERAGAHIINVNEAIKEVA